MWLFYLKIAYVASISLNWVAMWALTRSKLEGAY